MKTPKGLSLAILTLTFASIYLVSGCSEDNSVQPESDLKNSLETEVVDSANCSFIVFPTVDITDEEVDMIKYMREEEKLARDVYTTLSAQHTLPVFVNISKSEQKHMDLILCLINHYNITDPASEDIGVFINSELQELYNSLIAQGSVSLTEALTVGATIEDLDIHDLDEKLLYTENEAIISVFETLICGSNNHMRAFSRLLNKNETSYTPQFISQEKYDEIISSSNMPCGNCNGTGNGNGQGNGNGNGNGNGECDGGGN